MAHSRAVEQAQIVLGPLWLFLEVLLDHGPRFAPAWLHGIEAAATSVLVSLVSVCTPRGMWQGKTHSSPLLNTGNVCRWCSRSSFKEQNCCTSALWLEEDGVCAVLVATSGCPLISQSAPFFPVDKIFKAVW